MEQLFDVDGNPHHQDPLRAAGRRARWVRPGAPPARAEPPTPASSTSTSPSPDLTARRGVRRRRRDAARGPDAAASPPVTTRRTGAATPPAGRCAVLRLARLARRLRRRRRALELAAHLVRVGRGRGSCDVRTWSTRARSWCSRALALRVERALCRLVRRRGSIAVSYAVARAARSRERRRARRVPRSRRVRATHARACSGRGSGSPDDAPVIGAVARLDPLKGLDVLARRVRAWSGPIGPTPSSWSIGQPGARPGRATRRSFATRVAAYAGDPALRRAATTSPTSMADLDVLALPSIEPESYGLVLVEALASGTPVVATDHGGPPEIVARADAGNGARGPAGRRRRPRCRAPRAAPRAHLAGAPPGPAARLHAAAAAVRRASSAPSPIDPGRSAGALRARVDALGGAVRGRIGRRPAPARRPSPAARAAPATTWRRPSRRRYSAKYARSSSSVRARPLSAYLVTNGREVRDRAPSSASCRAAWSA